MLNKMCGVRRAGVCFLLAIILHGLSGLSASANEDYNNRCAGCHARQGEVGIAPSLFETTLGRAEFMVILRAGRNAMPGFSEADITNARANAVYDYLRHNSALASQSSSASMQASSMANASNRSAESQTNRRPSLAKPVAGNKLPETVQSHLPAEMDSSQWRADPFSPPQVYRQQCASCHGAMDAGLENPALQAQAIIPDLRFMKLSRQDFARIVLNGHSAMPAFASRMEAVHSANLYEWIREQRPTDTASAICRAEAIQQTHGRWGRSLYQMHCSRCHGVDGQGTRETRGRRAIVALNKPVAEGRIRNLVRKGHSIAPALPALTDSDAHQLSMYVSDLMKWSVPINSGTPDAFRALNGAKCQQQICAQLAQAADDKIAQNSNSVQTPNAGSAECAAWQKKHKRKGPAGPNDIYPACWGQAEVDKFESFCKEYRYGIASSYPQNRRVQAAPVTVTANTQLRSPWSSDSAVLTCQTGSALRYNLVDPNERNRMPNWRMRIYAPLLEKPNSKKNIREGGCWWEDSNNHLGAGNPSTGQLANQITLLVRLPDNGRVPKPKFWSSRFGLEDEDQPLASFSKTERPMYEMLRIYRAQEGQFSLRVYRNLDHDHTRNSRACAACGNSVFTNQPWRADASQRFP